MIEGAFWAGLALLGPDGPVWFGPLGPDSAGPDRVVVDPRTGALVVESVDLEIDGNGPPMAIVRRFTERGWCWGVERRVEVVEGRLEAVDCEGRRVADPAASDPLDKGGWLLREGGLEQLYDVDGRWSGVVDPHGNRQELVYGALGLERWRSAGREISFFHDPSGAFSVIASAGLELYYEVRQGRLVAVSGTERPRVRYTYDADGRLNGLLRGDGSQILVRRDADGRVSEIAGPGASRLRVFYGPRATQLQDAAGRTWTWSLEEGRETLVDPAGRRASSLRDGEGRLLGWEDPSGLDATLRRDSQGRITEIQVGGERWRLERSAGRITAMVDPAGGLWRVVRDAAGAVTQLDTPAGTLSWERDLHGAVVAVGRESIPTRLQRDAAGRVTAVVSPSGATTRLRRDSVGRLISVEDPAGNVILIGRSLGRIAEIVARDGARWALGYDGLGRLNSVESPLEDRLVFVRGGDGRLSRAGFASGAGHLYRWRADGRLSAVIDAEGTLTGLLHDAAGRLSAVIWPDHSRLSLDWSSTGELVGLGPLRVERDARGNPVRVGSLSWTWDALDRWITAKAPGVDLALGRDAEGSVTSVRAGETKWSFDLDGAGRAVGLRGGGEELRLGRDAAGRLALIEGGGRRTKLDRDERGLVVRLGVGEDSWRQLYDPEGRRVRLASADGEAISADRGPMGEILLLRFPDGTLRRRDGGSGTVGMVVEDAGGKVIFDRSQTTDTWGRAREVVQPGASWHLQRDAAGALVAVEGPQGPWSWLEGVFEAPDGSRVLYDEAGRPSQATPPSWLGFATWGLPDEVLGYWLDGVGRVERIAGALGEARLRYDGLGRPVSLAFQDGASWRLRWDSFGRLRGVVPPGGGPMELIWGPEGLLGWTQGGVEVEVLGLDGQGWALRREGGESLRVSLVGDAEGVPRVRTVDGVADRALEWSPYGLPTLGAPDHLAWAGAWALFEGGPILDGAGGWDPLSGRRLVPSGMGADADYPQAWPALDGASTPAWDPAPYAAASVWSDPLALLVALGELEPLVEGEWWTPQPDAPALPWLPASATRPEPPLAPGSAALPLDLDPVERVIVRAALSPVQPLDWAELGPALTEGELGPSRPEELVPGLIPLGLLDRP